MRCLVQVAGPPLGIAAVLGQGAGSLTFEPLTRVASTDVWAGTIAGMTSPCAAPGPSLDAGSIRGSHTALLTDLWDCHLGRMAFPCPVMRNCQETMEYAATSLEGPSCLSCPRSRMSRTLSTDQEPYEPYSRLDRHNMGPVPSLRLTRPQPRRRHHTFLADPDVDDG